MKINFINSFKSITKQKDKYILCIRLGRLTVIEISTDISRKILRLMLLNFGYDIKW